MREQSRLHSLLETLASIAIGFVVSLGITAVVLPAYGMLLSGMRNRLMCIERYLVAHNGK